MYVPAILDYAKKCHKKLITDVLSKQGLQCLYGSNPQNIDVNDWLGNDDDDDDDDDDDEVSRQVHALELLSIPLDKGSKLCYFYEEYIVS